MKRRLAFPLLFLLLAWVLPAWAESPLRLGVVAVYSKDRSLQQWRPLGAYLEQQLGQRVEVTAYTLQEFDAAVAKNQVDVAFTNPAHFILLQQRNSLSAPLATVITQHGANEIKGFGGVIFTRADTASINTLADIPGRRIAAFSRGSFGAFQLQAFEMLEAGLPVPDDASLVIERAQDLIVADVVEGRADVGFVRTGVLESLAGDGRLDLSRIKIINRQNLASFPYASSTRIYPEWPIGVFPQVSEHTARQLTSTLLMLKADTAAARAAGIHGFSVPAEYRAVEEVLRKLHAPPFEKGPEFTWRDIWRRHAIWIIALGVLILLLSGMSVVLFLQNHVILRSQEVFRTLFETVPQGVVYHSPRGLVTAANPAAERILGLSFAQMQGKSTVNAYPNPIHSDGSPFAAAAHPAMLAINTGKPVYNVVMGINNPVREQLVWININCVPIFKRGAGGMDYVYSTLEDITERKQAERRIIRLTRLYATLSHTNSTIVYARNRDDLFRNICRGAVEHGEFTLAWIGLVDEATRTVKAVTHYGAEAGYLDTIGISIDDVPTGRGPTATAIRENRGVYVNDFTKDDSARPWREVASRRGFRSSASIPFVFHGKVIGALSLYSKEPNVFDAEQLKLLEEMTRDVSFALDNLDREAMRQRAEEQRAQALHSMQMSLESVIQVAASITETRDPYTSGHQQRVAGLAGAIARELRLPDETIKGIHFGAMIHDIGKIAIPAEILTKPSQLTDLEYSLIKVHPQTGYDILKGVEFPWPIAQMLLQHHERLDGSGYPHGLKGEEMLLESRIIAVADVVEAMSTHRPYRPGLGMLAALDEIQRQRGVHYDARVVDACVTVIREHGYKVQGL